MQHPDVVAVDRDAGRPLPGRNRLGENVPLRIDERYGVRLGNDRRVGARVGELDDGDRRDGQCRRREHSQEDEGRAARPSAMHRRGELRIGRRGQGWILREDAPLQVLEVVTWLQSQLLGKGATGVPVRLKRVRLAPGAIEGKHELSYEPLAIRVSVNEPL